jgi:hypothetical protein
MTVSQEPILLKGFKPISGLSKWVQGIFIFFAIVSLVALISSYLQSQLIITIINGEFFTEDELLANDAREGFIAIVYFIVTIVVIIMFLVWVNRANKNIHSFQKPVPTFTSGWAVGWFFVPIMSLFRPYQVVSEIWKASNPDISPELNTVEHIQASGIVVLWWAFFLLSNFVGQIASRLLFDDDTLTDFLTSTYAYIVSYAIDVIGIIITIIMVRKISQFQELRHTKLSQINKQEVT